MTAVGMRTNNTCEIGPWLLLLSHEPFDSMHASKLKWIAEFDVLIVR